MQPFIHDTFLLNNPTAEELYHNHAKSLPIIDFHNHLSPKDIAEDRIFDNISRIWLEGDHYKWRAMRACGIDEYFITGGADDWAKFEKWAETVPRLLRNPLYHWTHMELTRYFDVQDLLHPGSAPAIYDRCNHVLTTPDFSVRNLLRKANVESMITIEDPVYDLNWHRRIRENFEIKVQAAFRPDPIFTIRQPETFREYVLALSQASNIPIASFGQLCQAFDQRHITFHEFGCRMADFALDEFQCENGSEREADTIFRKALSGKLVDKREANLFLVAILQFLCRLNHQRGWTQQFHLGALRDINQRGVRNIGAACGFDAVNDVPYVAEFGKFLNYLENDKVLARSICFNLNARDNDALAALVNTFNDGSSEGKMQYGPAWWFLDQKEGIEAQLDSLSVYGVLGTFIGMLTDSRSFLSFTRHEYFRRILCNVLGRETEAGLLPNDMELLGKTVEDICYNNSKKYLEI